MPWDTSTAIKKSVWMREASIVYPGCLGGQRVFDECGEHGFVIALTLIELTGTI